MTLEQLNEHADKLEAEGMAVDLTEAKTADEILGKICEIYHKVRPFLERVSNLFFLPRKWRRAIETFIGVLDGLCPTTEL